jgi:hypothetical protein
MAPFTACLAFLCCWNAAGLVGAADAADDSLSTDSLGQATRPGAAGTAAAGEHVSSRSVGVHGVSGTWKGDVANTTTVRWSAGTAVLGSELYAVGGFSTISSTGGGGPGGGGERSGPFATSLGLVTAERFNQTSKIWTRIHSMAAARQQPGVAALNGLLYAVGTGNGEVYDPKANLWSPIAPLLTARSSTAAAALKGLL